MGLSYFFFVNSKLTSIRQTHRGTVPLMLEEAYINENGEWRRIYLQMKQKINMN